MTEDFEERRRRRHELILISSLAALSLIIHLVANILDTYGYFRDELYYLACTEHLDIGYVDQPPFSIFLLAIQRAVLGDSLVMLRLLPALAGAATVFLTGLIVRELGGRMFAIVVASVASLVSLLNLAIFSIYSMNAFDVFVWTLAFYLILRIAYTNNTRLWVFLGLILGIGLLNKTGVLWLGCGLAMGIVATRWRTWLKTPWPWVAGGIAVLIFLPYVVWNVSHDFAHLEFIRRATEGKYSDLTRMDFVVGQLLIQNPVTFPVWGVGLFMLLFSRTMRPVRILGVIIITVVAILLINAHSKAEYLGAAYAPLFAAGGVTFEQWFARRRWIWARVVLGGLLVSGLVVAPMTLPILPVPQYLRYAEALGIKPSTSETLELAELPQFYADRFGWEEKAAAVARVYHGLSPEEQKVCRIYAGNYGRCGAIDFFGRRMGLPPAIGSHNSYWIWGPGDYDGQVLIVLGGNLEDHQEGFEDVVVAETIRCRYCMPYENDVNIYVCRGLKQPIGELWPQLKHYM